MDQAGRSRELLHCHTACVVSSAAGSFLQAPWPADWAVYGVRCLLGHDPPALHSTTSGAWPATNPLQPAEPSSAHWSPSTFSIAHQRVIILTQCPGDEAVVVGVLQATSDLGTSCQTAAWLCFDASDAQGSPPQRSTAPCRCRAALQAAAAVWNECSVVLMRGVAPCTPDALSNSYLTLDPLGISMTAWNTLGASSPMARSCLHEQMPVQPGPPQK